MGWEQAFTFFGHAMGRPAARKALKGFIQEWIQDLTWEEVQELISKDKSWCDLDQEAVNKACNLFTHIPGAIESISFEEVLQWIEQANSKLLTQVLSSTNGAVWLRKNFDLARAGLLKQPQETPRIVLVKIQK